MKFLNSIFSLVIVELFFSAISFGFKVNSRLSTSPFTINQLLQDEFTQTASKSRSSLLDRRDILENSETVLLDKFKSNEKTAKRVPDSPLEMKKDFNDIKTPSAVQEEVSGDLTTWGARVLLLVVAALYGTNFGCVKILGESLQPSVAAFLRFSVSSLVFAPWLVPNILSKPKIITGGIEVGIYSALGYFAQALALQTTHASTVAFICSLVVVVVPILDLLFGSHSKVEDKKSVSGFSAILPALLAATGVGFLELGGTDIPGIGDIWALGQPIFFGLAFWRTESLTRTFPDPADTKTFTGASVATIAFSSLIWSFCDYILPMWSQGKDFIMQSLMGVGAVISDWHVIAALLWTGIVTTALTIYGENRAMVKLSAAESTVIYSTEPLWGTAFAAVTLGEQLGWNTFFGAVLILTACLWSSLGPAITTAGILSTIQATVEMPEVLENMEMNLTELMKKWLMESS